MGSSAPGLGTVATAAFPCSCGARVASRIDTGSGASLTLTSLTLDRIWHTGIAARIARGIPTGGGRSGRIGVFPTHRGLRFVVVAAGDKGK